MLEAAADVCTELWQTEVGPAPPPGLATLSWEEALGLLSKGEKDPALLSESDVLALGRLHFKHPVQRTSSNAELLDYLEEQLFRQPALA